MKNEIIKLIRNAKVYTVFNPIKKHKGNLVERSIKPIFIYVGRLDDYQKNITFLLKGMSKIDKDFKLIIVGKGGDEERLKSLANDLGISQRIEWRGFKKDPYENLNEGVTALLLTSRFESFGMVLVEANQRGIPVISSDCQVGPADIVIPGVNGYLYPEGDMNAFVKIVNDVTDGKVRFGTP
ncbi:MAG: glycosyltransferase, partial [Thermodesulfobium sp.]